MVRAGAESLMDEIKALGSSASGGLQDLLVMLQDQCGVVSRILNDVLSLQKMEEGRFTLEMVPFSPEHLLRNTVESFAAGFHSRHQSVTVHTQSLESTICNLLSAAQALQPDSGGRDPMPSAARPGPKVNGSASPRSAEPSAMLIGGIACTLLAILCYCTVLRQRWLLLPYRLLSPATSA